MQQAGAVLNLAVTGTFQWLMAASSTAVQVRYWIRPTARPVPLTPPDGARNGVLLAVLVFACAASAIAVGSHYLTAWIVRQVRIQHESQLLPFPN